MRRGWPACALIVWLAGAAQAEPAREVAVALAWRADGCLDTAGLYRAVRSRRRPAREATGADAIVAGGAQVRPGGGWLVALVVTDRRGAILGRRSLEVADASCAALREHVALVVAMLVDSSMVERAVPTAAPPPVRREERWRGDAAAALLVEAGRLPGEEIGLAAAFGLTSRRGWRAELGLFAFAEATAGDGTGATSIRWMGGRASGCLPAAREGWWQGSACAGLDASVMSAEGSGFTRNQGDHKLLVDAVVNARTEFRLVGPTFLALALTGRLAALRPRFGYEDESGTFRALYEPKTAAATGEIGLGAHFP